jgi:sugar lactone lactonase YvrE
MACRTIVANEPANGLPRHNTAGPAPLEIAWRQGQRVSVSVRFSGIAVFVAIAAAISQHRLGAQSPTGVAAVDSASVARAAWTRASAAFAVHDMVAARREVDRAASAWPVQPAYLWARVVVAHMASDTDGVLRALEAYATLGLGKDLRADQRFSGYVQLPGFAAVISLLDSGSAPLVRSQTVATLADSTFWPEGMDYDSRTGRYYVASVRHRTIAEVEKGKVVRELWPRERAGIGAVLGLRVDSNRGVLWATLAGIPQMAAFTPHDSTIAALVRVRLSDGSIERRWDLPPAPLGHVLGDLAVSPLGDVFVTDSNDPALYRLRPGSEILERITSPLFRSLQGVAPTPNGSIAYVADYSHGLLRVDLRSGDVTRLDDAPGSTSLGCDGIAWHRDAIVAVQNGVSPARVMRFVLDGAGRRIVRADVLDRNYKIADEPTIGTIVGDQFVYVANSQWDKYTGSGARKPEKALTAPVLLAVPLPR